MNLKLINIFTTLLNRYIPLIFVHSHICPRPEYYLFVNTYRKFHSIHNSLLYSHTVNYDKMINKVFQSLNLITKGNLDDAEFKIYFSDASGNKVSPWHFNHIDEISSVDSDGNKVFPMIVEISKNQLEKLEIDTKTSENPIKQDLKNGIVRLYPKPNPFNYGAMPKTWEDPKEFVEEGGSKYFGDNDPLDLVEISPVPYKPGDILTVKVLNHTLYLNE